MSEREQAMLASYCANGDRAIIRYCVSDSPFYRIILIPDYDSEKDLGHLDLAACLEYTFHTALSNDMSEDDLWYFFGIMAESNKDTLLYPSESLLYVDLGYVALIDADYYEKVEL